MVSPCRPPRDRGYLGIATGANLLRVVEFREFQERERLKVWGAVVREFARLRRLRRDETHVGSIVCAAMPRTVGLTRCAPLCRGPDPLCDPVVRPVVPDPLFVPSLFVRCWSGGGGSTAAVLEEHAAGCAAVHGASRGGSLRAAVLEAPSRVHLLKCTAHDSRLHPRDLVRRRTSRR